MTTLFCIILLPIIPAYLLFAALPAEAAISGPLKGFRINLSGAFAGYFSLVLLLISTISHLVPDPQLKWIVSGQVVDATTHEPIQVVELRLSPSGQHIDGDGSFSVKFTTDRSDDGKNLDYPRLVIVSDRYKDEYVDLDPTSPLLAKHPVIEGQRIKIGQIGLTRLPPYIDPTANAPTNSASQ